MQKRWQQLHVVLGQGRVSVRIAVMGGQRLPDFRMINGLRSDLPGLGDWMTLRRFSHSATTGADGHLWPDKDDRTRETMSSVFTARAVALADPRPEPLADPLRTERMLSA